MEKISRSVRQAKQGKILMLTVPVPYRLTWQSPYMLTWRPYGDMAPADVAVCY
jgi:hypothetical protein